MTRHKDRNRPSPNKDRSDTGGLIWLWGTHAVTAALKNPARKCRKLLVGPDADPEILRLAGRAKAMVEQTDHYTIDRILPRDAVHQGLALHAFPLPEHEVAAVIDRAKRPCCLVLLDQVTDPHNFGAVIRSAAAFGACGIIVQDRHTPPIGGVLAKAASGALETVPIIHVVNISRTLEQLGKDGFMRLAFADGENESLAEVDLNRDIVLVLGSEGEGIRRLTRENCDVTVRLPTTEAMPSLNVSNAAAVALYAWSTAKKV
ncbi:MAG: 23S rRNA (guanosine(2251)-2'-O)-methyltransferase RlmB [Micropepsaceae bacterium]